MEIPHMVFLFIFPFFVEAVYAIPQNITIGLLAPYCAVPNITTAGSFVSNYPSKFDPRLIDVYGWAGWAFLNDALINSAISSINNSSDILPDVHINIKRFSSCGPYDPSANDYYNGSPIGFASAIMSDDIVNIHTDVIAVIGSDISSVTIPTAEILSIYQIPYCSVCAASPALSNKDMFSYFWRPQLENFGQALVVFLLALNVKQIAVLYQPFSSYGYVSQEVVSEAQRHGIRIVAKLSLSQSPSVSLEEALFVTMSLNRVSARYIVMIGDSSKVSGILYRVGKLGIFGPKFVWLVYNEPTTSAPLIEYGPDYETYASNYICVGRTDVNLTATANQFYSYTQITKSDLSSVDLFQNSNVRFSADCVMNMLYGLDKLLKTNKSVTPDLLSSRKGNALLDYTRFQDTGYGGLAFHPFQLTETGDLKAPTVFASVSRNSSLDFGETNANSTLFTFYSPNLPVFFNRSTIRPSDGSKPEPILYSYSLETIDGQWILILCTLGITACILATLFLYVARETASVKAASVAESFTIILACLLCYLSLFGSFGVKTWAKCHFQWLGLSSGYNLGLSTILCKNLLLVRLFGRKLVKRPEREVLIFRVLNWGLVIIHFVLLVWIITYVQLDLLKVIFSKGELYFQICTPKSDTTPLSVLQGYSIFLLISILPSLYLMQRVRWETHNESTFLIVIACTMVLCFLLVQLMPTSSESEFRVAVCIWVATSVVLTSLVIPKVAAARLDWLESKTKRKKEGFSVSSEPKSTNMDSFTRSFMIQKDRQLVSDASFTALGFKHGRAKYSSKVLCMTVDQCVYKFKFLGEYLWSEWLIGQPELHRVRDRVWLSLNSKKFYHCVSILQEDLTTTGNKILINIPNESNLSVFGFLAGAGNAMLLEFKNDDEANAFLAELKTTLTRDLQ